MLKDDQHNSYLDLMLTEIIDHLSNGHSIDAADGLVQLARFYARAGMPIETFYNMRKYIVGSAINKAGNQEFIINNLKVAEQQLRKDRNINNIH